MTRRLEAAHGPLALARRLMCVLGAVIEPPVPAMLNTRYDLLLCCLVAPQLVRDEHAWNILRALEQLAEHFLGSSLVSSALHQDIQYVAVLIDCPPHVLRLAIDL